MGYKGMNQRALPQFLKPENALLIKNYFIDAPGKLRKRKGLLQLFTRSGAQGITMVEKYNDDHYIIGYDTKLEVYSISGDTTTTIKTFTTGGTFSGNRYGDYFFVTNNTERLGKVTRNLAYDALVKNFTSGQTVTGGTSGATATVLQDIRAYTPAYLTGGNSATSNFATWAAVTNGEFAISIDGTAYNITQIDFTGVTSMAEVATKIQTAIRLATESTETCVWSTNHFVITSADATSSSAMTVTSAVSGGIGTDISGVAATAYLDAETGHGTVTAKVAGTTGTLVLGDVSGTFANNEALTDPKGGSATEDGTLTWTYTTVSGAPTCKVVRAIGDRLFCGGLSSDLTAVAYSNQDTGTNPPFSSWTVAATSTSPGLINFRNGGEVNDIQSLEENIVVFAKNGKWAFRIDVLDVGGTLTKSDTKVLARVDSGGERGAKLTEDGIYYVNSTGVWLLRSLGKVNVPYDELETEVSWDLGPTYFDNFDFSDADIAYDRDNDCILVTCANDSSTNNQVMVYNLTAKAWSYFAGWNVNRFLDDNGTLYGAGSSENTVWKLYDDYNDDGVDIYTEYYQEMNVGGLDTNKSLEGIYIQGELSPSTDITVAFDIYTTAGLLVEDKMKLQWTPTGLVGGEGGYGLTAFGSGAWGGFAEDLEQTSFAGARQKINNFMRIRVRLTCNDQAAHTVNWFSLDCREKRAIRRRNLTNIT